MRYKCSCPHGYIRYTHGCRCEKCRAAKAAYMAGRRAEAYHAEHQIPDGIRHGTAFAYEEHGCRCEPCVTAEKNSPRFRKAPRP